MRAHRKQVDEDEAMAIRTREKALKRVYAHYATLNMYSSTTEKITWRTIEKLNATLNEDEFVTWLVNFEVVPHLMSKGEALAIFHEVEEANDADGEVGEMLYPAFTEVLGQLAVTAFANVAPMLRIANLRLTSRCSTDG